jgi:hypothetical protein
MANLEFAVRKRQIVNLPQICLVKAANLEFAAPKWQIVNLPRQNAWQIWNLPRQNGKFTICH